MYAIQNNQFSVLNQNIQYFCRILIFGKIFRVFSNKKLFFAKIRNVVIDESLMSNKISCQHKVECIRNGAKTTRIWSGPIYCRISGEWFSWLPSRIKQEGDERELAHIVSQSGSLPLLPSPHCRSQSWLVGTNQPRSLCSPVVLVSHTRKGQIFFPRGSLVAYFVMDGPCRIKT